MLVNYDLQKINTALHDFYNATGIHMDLLREDFTFVNDRSHWGQTHYCKCVQETKEGQASCIHSDQQLLLACRESKTMQLHLCPAGLVDVAVPILYDDTILGYIIFGCMKTDTDFASVAPYVKALGLCEETMHRLYNEIPFYDSDKIQSVSNIASMLVKHLLLENMLRPDYDENIQKAVAFINQNLDRDLSVRTVSRGAGISKSVLYKRFHACFGCTISEYIHQQRIERAAVLLHSTTLPVEQISQQIGYSSASYFSKSFKKHTGYSPLNYRKRR